jgi:hypothetical protein
MDALFTILPCLTILSSFLLSQNSTMPNQFTILLLILPFVISPIPQFVRVAEASNRRVHITDDLDDIIDDEEDDAWKQWGKKSTPSPELDLRPSDLSAMSAPEIQAEMMKRHSGPAFVISPIPQFVRVAEASNRRFHITDDLDDVVDD